MNESRNAFAKFIHTIMEQIQIQSNNLIGKSMKIPVQSIGCHRHFDNNNALRRVIRALTSKNKTSAVDVLFTNLVLPVISRVRPFHGFENKHGGVIHLFLAFYILRCLVVH